MFRARQRVLIDTNVIIEAHRTGCWIPLANHFALETVEKVIEETQTGSQNRSPQTLIDEKALRASFHHVATVDDEMRTALLLSAPQIALDPGERDLLAYAGTLSLGEAWLLNSPDVAAIRYMHSRGWLDRVVSLEAMNSHLKVRLTSGSTLKVNYTEGWLSRTRTTLILS